MKRPPFTSRSHCCGRGRSTACAEALSVARIVEIRVVMTAAVARCVRKRRSTALCRAAAPFVFMARGVPATDVESLFSIESGRILGAVCPHPTLQNKRTVEMTVYCAAYRHFDGCHETKSGRTFEFFAKILIFRYMGQSLLIVNGIGTNPCKWRLRGRAQNWIFAM